MTIKTKYITTNSKESADNNELLLSLDIDGDASIIHTKDMKGIMIYADQIKKLILFLSKKEM